MPGLVGMTYEMHDADDAAMASRSTAAMREMITHGSNSVRDEAASQGGVCGARSHIGVYQCEAQPVQVESCRVWLDGVLNNRQEVAAARQWSAGSDAALIGLIASHEAWDMLRELDGFFTAVVHDELRSRAHLITDRYGLRRLYWAQPNGRLVWGSELKAMLAVPRLTTRIDPRAVSQFMQVGYHLGNRTWFEGVEVLGPAMVLTWDTAAKRVVSRKRYWWWDQITPRGGRWRPRELATELGQAFRRAVERRTTHHASHGVFLSGGLDSRAILAALPEACEPIPVVTFGTRSCDDVRVARAAAQVRPTEHLVVELGSSHWFLPRLSGVWWTDGELPLIHMHGIEARESISVIMDVNLSGFAGDVILGGSRLPRNRGCAQGALRQYLAQAMGCDESILEDVEAFEGLQSTDLYFLHNRMRRLINGGTRQSLTSIERQKPFYDNEVIEFAYSLPDDARREGGLYRMMLLQCFGAYFRTIPYAMEGTPISVPHVLTRARAKILRGMKHLGLGSEVGRRYADYGRWMRMEPARSFIDGLLMADDTLYGEHVDRASVMHGWTRHLWGKDETNFVARCVTLELWLQQSLAGRFRSAEADEWHRLQRLAA